MDDVFVNIDYLDFKIKWLQIIKCARIIKALGIRGLRTSGRFDKLTTRLTTAGNDKCYLAFRHTSQVYI